MEKVKITISLCIFFFINLAFAVKYTSDITPYYIPVSFAIVIFYWMCWKFRFQVKHFTERFRYLNHFLIAGFILIFSFVFIKIPVENIDVDRWSVITSFWDSYFNGQYVYFAQSYAGNFPGPMPFYFILALPFYEIGELGYFSLLGIIAFVLLMHFNAKPRAVAAFYSILLMSSLFYLWEVTCRSNILLNGILILISITFFFKNSHNWNRSSIIVNGIIIGLLLSTRNVFVIPYIITMLFALKSKRMALTDMLLFGFVCVFVFVLTFVPFVLNHTTDFWQMNPFIIQSSVLMPITYTISCIVLALLSVFVVKQISDVYFYSGLVLFVTCVLHYCYKLTIYSFNDTFFGSMADISYLMLCIPFFIYYLVEKEDVTKFGSPRISSH